MASAKNPTTLDEIRDILEKRYNKVYDIANPSRRSLIVTQSERSCFIELQGTPPKGFGIYIPESKRLFLYDLDGKCFKAYKELVVNGL
jgi:hypothetical protein